MVLCVLLRRIAYCSVPASSCVFCGSCVRVRMGEDEEEKGVGRPV